MAEFRQEIERLILRDWREEDWEEFWRLTNTKSVMRWLGGPASAEDRVAAKQRLEQFSSDWGHTFWVVERKRDGAHLAGEMLGFCGLKRGTVPSSPVYGVMEVGWRLREDAWGRGYAKEAAAACLDLGFGRFGAERVMAWTVEGNTASWGLMRRLGMTRRPDLDFQDDRFGPELNPAIVYMITAGEWQARQ